MGDYSREAIYRGTAVIRGNTVNGGMILVRWVNETIHCTVNDQINARIVYLILRIQAGAYKRSTEANKLLANIHYWHQLILLGRLEIYIPLSNPNIDMSKSSFSVIVLPLLVYPYFEIDIERDEIQRKA